MNDKIQFNTPEERLQAIIKAATDELNGLIAIRNVIGDIQPQNIQANKAKIQNRLFNIITHKQERFLNIYKNRLLEICDKVLTSYATDTGVGRREWGIIRVLIENGDWTILRTVK